MTAAGTAAAPNGAEGVVLGSALHAAPTPPLAAPQPHAALVAAAATAAAEELTAPDGSGLHGTGAAAEGSAVGGGPDSQKIQKRKVALFLAYVGAGYSVRSTYAMDRID